MERRLNLEDIGRLAGVSRSTASRVVNGEPNVSDQVVRRVRQVISETGYQPHAAARSLASNRTGVIGLVIPGAVQTLFDDPYFGRLILGVTGATNSLGTTLAFFLFGTDADEESITPRVVNSGLVDGVIVTASVMGDPLISDLRSANMPFVVVGRPDSAGAPFSVDVDNRGGAYAAASYLAQLGHERIGMITPPSNTTAGVDRRGGFLDAIADAGLSVDGRMEEGQWSEESGRAAMERLLLSSPDAVFVASDRMAIGALRAIRDAGLRCPEDIAVVSFDGLLSGDQTDPRLTSVRQSVTEVGDRAARLLHSVIDGTVSTPEHVVYPTEMIVRESCGAAGSHT